MKNQINKHSTAPIIIKVTNSNNYFVNNLSILDELNYIKSSIVKDGININLLFNNTVYSDFLKHNFNDLMINAIYINVAEGDKKSIYFTIKGIIENIEIEKNFSRACPFRDGIKISNLFIQYLGSKTTIFLYLYPSFYPVTISTSK